MSLTPASYPSQRIAMASGTWMSSAADPLIPSTSTSRGDTALIAETAVEVDSGRPPSRVQDPLRFPKTPSSRDVATASRTQGAEHSLRNRAFEPRQSQKKELEFFSDAARGDNAVKRIRAGRKRAENRASLKESAAPEGSVWALCVAKEFALDAFLDDYNKLGVALHRGQFSVTSSYDEVIFCRAFEDSRMCFVFKFGCVVGWDFTPDQRSHVLKILRDYMRDPNVSEEDEMSYVFGEHKSIKQDTIHLVSDNDFEKLAYSYAFAQSVKLSYFEIKVDSTIERTKSIPEGLALTGTINETREDISRRIGDLFINRFYINIHTDILDTPTIFWDFDEFADHYSSCRNYLEIPKRVDILNQRLDIIKDLYDMLNDELTIQQGHRLEWYVIYLICIEVAIEVVWNILIKDLLHLF